MNTSLQTPSILQPFANSFAGLLKQLSRVNEIAALDAYQSDIVPHSVEKIAEQRFNELLDGSSRKLYEDELRAAHPNAFIEGVEGTPAAVWQLAADGTAKLTQALAAMDYAAVTKFVNSQGIDLTANNLSEQLAPKVTEWLVNPEPALAQAQLAGTVGTVIVAKEGLEKTIPTAAVKLPDDEAEIMRKTAAPENPTVVATPALENQEKKEIHKHDLQDSVVRLVSTLLTAARGVETSINREEAAELINTYKSETENHLAVFDKHSDVHYTHDLMRIADDFDKHKSKNKPNLIIAAVLAHKKAEGAEITFDQAKEALPRLEKQDMVALLKHGFNTSPEYLNGLAKVSKHLEHEKQAQHDAKPLIAEPKKLSFTDKLPNLSKNGFVGHEEDKKEKAKTADHSAAMGA